MRQWVIPFLGVYVKKPKTLNQKDICIYMIVVTLFTIVKIWKQPKYPIGGWIKKKWCIYTKNYDSAIKKMNSCHLQQHGWT